MSPDPDFVAEMWKRQDSHASSEREGLTVDRIIEKVIEIARTDGVGNVSMARLAREIGFSPMALYRHIPNKSAMLEIALDTAVGSPPEALGTYDDWQTGIMQFARELGRRYRAESWVFDVRISGPPTLPNSVKWMEIGFRILADAGLPPAEQVAMIQTITAFVRGNEQLLMETRNFPDQNSGGWKSYGRQLSEVTDAEAFPALWNVLESGVLDEPSALPLEEEHELEILFALERIIAGIEVMVSKSSQCDSEEGDN